MSGSGGSAVSRSHGGDRFYNPPAMRRHQQMLLQQHQQLQTQLQRASKSDSAATSAVVDAGNRTDSDDSAPALFKPSSIRLPSPPIPPAPIVTNLDRFLESVTPFVTAHHLSEVKKKGLILWHYFLFVLFHLTIITHYIMQKKFILHIYESNTTSVSKNISSSIWNFCKSSITKCSFKPLVFCYFTCC